MHLLVRHEVADFAKWKPVDDDDPAARRDNTSEGSK
jgi:hypothetical protein